MKVAADANLVSSVIGGDKNGGHFSSMRCLKMGILTLKASDMKSSFHTATSSIHRPFIMTRRLASITVREMVM